MTPCAVFRGREAAARAWKRAGGKVIGIFADDVPTALIEAAGFLPYRISGDPDGGQPAAMARGPTDIRADRFELPNSWLHLIATGRYDFVDHYVVSNSRKYILQMHERLAALDNPPNLHVLDRALGDSAMARDYNFRQIAKLRTALESWSGAEISADRLAEAIQRRNALADAARRIAAFREGGEVRLSGTAALHLFAAMRLLPSVDALPTAHNALAVAETVAPIEGRRLFVAGSPLDHDEVYREAEAAGFVIVGESHRWGGRSLEVTVPGGDPFTAVAAHYHAVPDFVVPLAASVDEAAQRFRRSRAELLLQYVWSHDDASLWEAPSERAAIAAPAALLTEQPYRFVPGSIDAVLASITGKVAA